MPTAVIDPFGNTIQACSISTAVKAKFDKDKFSSEAEWSKHVKADAFNTLRQKILNGEIPKNTVVGRDVSGKKLVYKGDNVLEYSTKVANSDVKYELDAFEYNSAFEYVDWDFGPNMAKMAQAQKAVVNTPAKLKEWLDKYDNEIDPGHVVAVLKQKSTGKEWKLEYSGDWDDAGPLYNFVPPKSGGSPIPFSHGQADSFLKSDGWEASYKVGQTPDVPAAAGLPVSSTSTSKGALTNEDAATMFVKTKDKLAQEAGINIKGASGKLDELVYKTIADQAGYTPAEMLAKVEAYKGSGKKLSALKKKVLPKSGNPTKVATETSVNKATAAVKKEEIKPVEVPQVWDSEAVAKAYVKAKDHVVATNNNGWTLYTKNDDFDAEIHKWMQADLGPIKKETADTAIADYIANHQKLSVLKKQMIKKGELTPQADTLKGKKEIPNGASNPDELGKMITKNADAYADSTVAVLKDSSGAEYQVNFKNLDDGQPFYEFKYPGGSSAKMTHSELEDVVKSGDYSVEYTIKPAPKETGAGQVGKTTEDPKVIGPKQQLTEAQEKAVFEIWESSNLPITAGGYNLYVKAQYIAKNYELGKDILPVLRALDKYKAQKFGVPNGNLYEKKVVEWLEKNPSGVPTGSTGSYGSMATKEVKTEAWGELPEDSEMFELIGSETMHNLSKSSMRSPSAEQRSVLKAYSGSYYHEINNHLRAGGSLTSRGKHLQDAMSPLPEHIIVRRGTRIQGLGLNSIEELPGAIGKTFVEPGFSSTAVGGGQFSGQVNLVIQAPKGTPAVWLKPYSSFSHENELLLKAGTKYKILKVERIQDGVATRTVVHVRVVSE